MKILTTCHICVDGMHRPELKSGSNESSQCCLL